MEISSGLFMKLWQKELPGYNSSLTSEMEALYHQASLKLGITDSISIVLYTIYDEGFIRN